MNTHAEGARAPVYQISQRQQQNVAGLGRASGVLFNESLEVSVSALRQHQPARVGKRLKIGRCDKLVDALLPPG